MKNHSPKILGLFFVLLTHMSYLGCSPADDDVGGSGGAAPASGGNVGSGGATGSGGVGSGGGPASGGSASGGGPSSGGSASGGSDSTIEASFATFQFILEAYTCDASDCHGHEGNPMILKPHGVKPTPDELYTILTTDFSDDCGMPVLTPGNPAQSALVQVLKGTCGEVPQMPDGCDPDPAYGNCVPAEYAVAIEQWVANGAPKE